MNEDADPIAMVRATFGLDSEDLVNMFGMTVSHLEAPVPGKQPPGFTQKLAVVSEIAQLLATRLRPERIPQVVRRPADAFGGLSMLEAIAAGQHEAVLEETRASFDWATQP